MATTLAPPKAKPGIAPAADYSKVGPCGVSAGRDKFDVPVPLQKGLGAKLDLEFLVPSHRDCIAAPLLIFFNGFSQHFSDYKATNRHVASWGYAVACYNLHWGPAIFQADDERNVFPALVKWLRAQGLVESSPLYGVVSAKSPVFVAGHSRGGTVAGLVFAAHPTLVTAAWLIDPVDSKPVTAQDPSAVAAVTGMQIGVVGAGIIGLCNPPGRNYVNFFAAARGWQVIVPGAAHATFGSTGPTEDTAKDALCGYGIISRPEAASLATVPMLNWFDHELNGGGGALSPIFVSWVEIEAGKGHIKFTVKP